jgi:NitT/TauT family transport system substrate-binding protein
VIRSLAGALLAMTLAQAPAALTTIRVAAPAGDSVTPILYAEHEGLFRKAGLDVVVRRAGSGAAIAAGVAGGSIDIGSSNILSLVSAHVRGLNFVLVAPAALHIPSSPGSGILVAPNSPIRSAKDLDGKTVSVPGLGDIGQVGISAWVDANGGDSSTLHFVEMPVSSVVAALDQGRIDAGDVVEPLMSQAIKSGKARYLGDLIGGIASTVLESAFFTSEDYLEKNRGVVERFAKVVDGATEYTNKHQAQTVDLVADFTGADPNTVAHMVRGINGTSLDPRYIQPTIDAAAKYKVIPAPFDARDLIGVR